MDIGKEGFTGKGKGHQHYTTSGDTPENCLDKFRNNIIEPIKINLKNKRTALDIGCGNGRHCSELSEVFDSVIGIDNSYTYDSRFARDNIEFHTREFPVFVSETKFDLILFWGVFYMMGNYKDAITQCYRLLQDNGILIIGEEPCRGICGCSSGHDYDLNTLIEENNLQKISELVSEYRITIIGKV